MSKVSRIEEKLKRSFDTCDYYEAHQIYRTLYARLASQGRWDELQDLLFNGTLKLIDAKEPTSAVDLAELFAEALQKAKTLCTPTTIGRFEQLYSRLPASLSNDTSTPDGCSGDRRTKFLNLGVKWTMSVGTTKRQREKGHPDFHRMVGRVLWKEENYFVARSHFLLSDDAESFGLFLVAFQQKRGHGLEYDLFIAQAVLQVLCSGRFSMGSTLLRVYCMTHPSIHMHPPYVAPLLNFMWLLTLAIPLRKVSNYTTLVEKYKKCLDRDPSFRTYLDKIGQVYFGVPPPPKSTPWGVLGNLVKGLMGNQEGAGTSTQEVDEEINEEELRATVDEQGFEKAAHSADIAAPETSAGPGAAASGALEAATNALHVPVPPGAVPTSGALSMPALSGSAGPAPRPPPSATTTPTPVATDDMDLD